YFDDPDGDSLAFSATSSNRDVVSLSVSGSTVTVSAVSQGSATATVTATDPGGLSTSQSFEVTVPNRAPEVLDSIPAQQLDRRDSVQLDMAPYFDDPDGDSLAFSATSSNRDIVSLSVSGSTVTVAAVSQGSATATVTATDPGGLSASQSFEVTVPNRAPEVLDSIPAQQLDRRESVQLDMAAYFNDPDGDSLAYVAVSADSAVVSLSVSGSTVTVSAKSRGSATATVTATDPGGLSTSQSFRVTVLNRAPEILNSVPGLWLGRGEFMRLDMAAYFDDPDGDSLVYAAVSSDSAVVSLSVSGSTVTVSAMSQGSATATVTATDPGDLSISQSFEVTVPNRAPEILDSIPAQQLGRRGSVQLDMAAYFDDPDGDILAYAAVPSDSAVVSLSVSGSTVTVSAVSQGSATATVTATDPGGLFTSQGFEVTVGSGDRDILEALYEATNGNSWTTNTNWMTDRPLDEWYGVVASREQVTALRLGRNNLTGSIPPEIGNLTNLVQLRLHSNDLTGPIPPEIGNLSALREIWAPFNDFSGPLPPEIGKLGNLESLWLYWNRITGPLPAELGNLTNLVDLRLELNEITGRLPPTLGNLAKLERLELRFNRLSGPIPPEFGNLGSLRRISIHGYENRLTGEIPPELGNLSKLEHMLLPDNELTGELPREFGKLGNLVDLALHGNKLTGELPTEFGNLGRLKSLQLENNDLSGPIPPELKRMSRLEVLKVANNRDMAGTLPSELTELPRLNTLMTDGTALCAPSDPGFLEWLKQVYKRRIRPCDSTPDIYLVQAVQSRGFPVPLVAGERALLRVFLTATGTNTADIPGARARFFVDDNEIHSQYIAGKPGPIPTEVREGDLSKSLNAEIAAAVVRPGLQMVIEVDPVDAGLGVPRRIPEAGRLEVEVYPVSPFDITVIPFLWASDPDSSIIDIAEDMAEDPDGHELLRETHTLLPVADVGVTAHEPVLTSSNHPVALLRETRAIRTAEGGEGHYMGTMTNTAGGIAGVGYTPGKSIFAIPDVSAIAHEFGHNLSLHHAPCYTDGDPSYPYDTGRIGAWGWDFRDGGKLVDPGARDLMGYCNPRWISDFHFTNAMRFRVNQGDTDTQTPHARTKGLLLWGGIGVDGTLFLEPAFVLDAPPALPRRGSGYRIEGRDGAGTELFSLSFDMPVVADGEGASGFAFVLPAESRWEGTLASITLSGPEGTITLDEDTARPMAILRNRRTGQIRGILRDLPLAARTRADAAALLSTGPGLSVWFSRGIPDREAWQ
ncbi:MAG: hypothetical protein OXL34_01775, partial [Gemmatimonadota bacterium]|nr:hypothetical protein [Gemmatimonadota bacterium]